MTPPDSSKIAGLELPVSVDTRLGRREEALGDGVVEGVAAAAHARQHAGVLHRLAEGK